MTRHHFNKSSSSFPPPSAWNYYVNWAILAILGRLGEADSIISRYRSQVYSVAHYLQGIIPPPLVTLYRGIFLEPHEVHNGHVKPDIAYQFISFTEDKEVACWFADPRSSVSGEVMRLRPASKGYIITHNPSPKDILFYYSWRGLPGAPWSMADIVDLARMHPQAAFQVNQLDWALDTQKEVILKPINKALKVTRREDFGCPDIVELEARLGPTWKWMP